MTENFFFGKNSNSPRWREKPTKKGGKFYRFSITQKMTLTLKGILIFYLNLNKIKIFFKRNTLLTASFSLVFFGSYVKIMRKLIKITDDERKRNKKYDDALA